MDQNSEEKEAAPQEPIVDESIENAEVQEQPPEEPAEDKQERNWRAMRQRQREMEVQLHQKDELIGRFMESQKPQAAPEVEEEEEEPDDTYVPKGRVKGIAQKTVRPLEKKLEELESKLAKQEQDKHINSFKTKYPDFDDVVTVETLELLEKKEPELAATIAQMSDPVTKGLQCYKFIKALGLAAEVPTARRVKEVEKKLEANSKTVQSPQAYDKRPMAQAFKTTAADKKRLYEEMMQYAAQAHGY
ncbi:MAG: hypothetical protein KAS32_29295 [Candidatus Peribacteraceae bacterium]|nr:hypothetical protein [Candidatus Peribacteraceae bacterium]